MICVYDWNDKKFLDIPDSLFVPFVVCDIMSYFDYGAIGAARAVFGANANLQRCFFHQCQSTWRRIQELGLVQLYHNDTVVMEFVGKLDGLAFVPMVDLVIYHLCRIILNLRLVPHCSTTLWSK